MVTIPPTGWGSPLPPRDGRPRSRSGESAGGVLYHYNGDGPFTNVTSSAGVSVTGSCWAAVLGDFDNDGDTSRSGWLTGEPLSRWIATGDVSANRQGRSAPILCDPSDGRTFRSCATD